MECGGIRRDATPDGKRNAQLLGVGVAELHKKEPMRTALESNGVANPEQPAPSEVVAGEACFAPPPGCVARAAQAEAPSWQVLVLVLALVLVFSSLVLESSKDWQGLHDCMSSTASNRCVARRNALVFVYSGASWQSSHSQGLDHFMESLGLSKYTKVLQQQDLTDPAALQHLTDEDLKDLQVRA